MINKKELSFFKMIILILNSKTNQMILVLVRLKLKINIIKDCQ